MCKRLVMIISVLIFMLVSSPVFALEFELKFDADDYRSRVWVTAGATHTYLPTGGWSGGAAKFTPCTSEGYSGLDIGTTNSKRVNIRFLYYVGATYQTGGNNKWSIFMPNPYADAKRLIFYEHESAGGTLKPQICHSTWPCTYSDFDFRTRLQEWLCFEMESDLDADTVKLYLTTQDGAYNGKVIATHVNPSGSTSGVWSSIQIIGGYYQEMPGADPDRYVKYDELKVSTSGYIGPPPGFLGSGQRPAAPQGLRIVN